MRPKLLAGAAFIFMFASLPTLSLVGPEDGQRVEPGMLEPLAINRALCLSRAIDGAATRRGLFLAAARAYAATDATTTTAAGGTAAAPPLIDGVASDALEVTLNDAARPYFEQGMGLVDGFNHFEAIRAFQAAQALDPDCAMCFWGEAYALGPNINDTMDPKNNARAVEAARMAAEKADGATDVEKALIEALAKRYSDEAGAERAELDKAYSDAMQEVADRFPEHDQVQALAAEAIMDAQPWDYWEPGGKVPKGDAAKALERIETVLERNPDHVLAIHLHIHLTEASDDPWRAAAGAERLASLAPGAGHLVHMPAHTWFRIGRFRESLEANVEAVKVDQEYLEEAGDAASVIYRYGYYPHNVHFVLTSAQMAGDGATALKAADDLDAALPIEMADNEGWVQLIKAAPLFARVQFGDEEVLKAILADETERALPFIKAARIYARGEAAARLGRADEARREAEALAALDEATDWESAIPGMPGAAVVDIMHETVLGRAALAEGDTGAAVEHFGRATEMQAALPYLEPPFWYYPARQSYAAALLADGQAERAEQEFFATLVESPDNGWAYWGLAEARKAQGDSAGAEGARAMWQQAWIGDGEPELAGL